MRPECLALTLTVVMVTMVISSVGAIWVPDDAPQTSPSSSSSSSSSAVSLPADIDAVLAVLSDDTNTDSHGRSGASSAPQDSQLSPPSGAPPDLEGSGVRIPDQESEDHEANMDIYSGNYSDDYSDDEKWDMEGKAELPKEVAGGWTLSDSQYTDVAGDGLQREIGRDQTERTVEDNISGTDEDSRDDLYFETEDEAQVEAREQIDLKDDRFGKGEGARSFTELASKSSIEATHSTRLNDVQEDVFANGAFSSSEVGNRRDDFHSAENKAGSMPMSPWSATSATKRTQETTVVTAMYPGPTTKRKITEKMTTTRATTTTTTMSSAGTSTTVPAPSPFMPLRDEGVLNVITKNPTSDTKFPISSDKAVSSTTSPPPGCLHQCQQYVWQLALSLQPARVLVERDSNVTLRCRLDVPQDPPEGMTGPTVSWSFWPDEASEPCPLVVRGAGSGNCTTFRGSVEEEFSNSTVTLSRLLIPHTQPFESGEYGCVAAVSCCGGTAQAQTVLSQVTAYSRPRYGAQLAVSSAVCLGLLLSVLAIGWLRRRRHRKKHASGPIFKYRYQPVRMLQLPEAEVGRQAEPYDEDDDFDGETSPGPNSVGVRVNPLAEVPLTPPNVAPPTPNVAPPTPEVTSAASVQSDGSHFEFPRPPSELYKRLSRNEGFD